MTDDKDVSSPQMTAASSPASNGRPSVADDTEDMAAVGRSLMDSIDTLVKGDPRFKHWAPAQDPAEIVFDVVNMLDESNDHVIRLQAALLLVRGIIKDGAMVGFNPLEGDWAERLFASQGTTKNALAPIGSAPPTDGALPEPSKGQGATSSSKVTI